MGRKERGRAKSNLTAAPDAAQPFAGTLGRAAVVGLAAAVAAIVALVHAPVLSSTALAFDDYDYVIRNPLVLNPGPASASRFLTEVLEPSTVPGYYQPLTMISLMLDAAAGGRADDLRPFHGTSLLLHALNAALVMLLLQVLFGRIGIAAAIGLLFGLHPLTVEAVAWLGERKTLLATSFSLAALLVYVAYTRRPGPGRYLACAVLFGLALLSKPTSTPLPMVMLLLDFWPLRRVSWRAALEKVPLLAIAGASALITVVSQGRTAAAVTPDQYDALRIPMIVCHNMLFYPLKMLWPVDLTPHYPPPEPLTPANPMVLAGVIATPLVLAALLAALRWTRAPLTAGLIFFSAILPTLGVIGFTNVIASDKYAYLPAFGFLMLLAAAAARLSSAADIAAQRRRSTVVVAGLLILATAAAVGTRRQHAVWRDTQTLTAHMLTLAPNSGEVLTHHGYHLDERGDTAGAIACYERIIARNPCYPRVQYNLGSALLKLRRAGDALNHLTEAVRQNPRDVSSWNNLGTAWLHQNNLSEARSCFARAVELDAADPEARNNLGVLLLRSGDAPAARPHLQEAVRLDPRNFRARANLADALARGGEDAEALRQLAEALRLRPDYARGALLVAEGFLAAGRAESAAAALRLGLRSNPGDAALRERLAGIGGRE